MRPEIDCLVVGAGPVGAAQALALAGTGFSVAVVDRRGPLVESGATDARGLALAPSSRAVLERIGVWPQIESAIQPIRRIHVSSAGRFGSVRMSARDIGWEALGYVCAADTLMQALERSLLEQCCVFWHTRIDAVRYAGDRVYLGTEPNGVPAARLLVGADGARSQVRELLGIDVAARDYAQSAIVANVTVEGAEPDTAYERFTREGPLALLPVHGGRHVLVRCCASARLAERLALDEATYLAECADGFGGRFRRFSELGQRSAHPLALVQARRIVDERAALVGAAATAIHPNAAQGLNLGLRDAAALTDCVEQHANDDIGEQPCLRAYADSRRADQRAVARFTDTLAQVFTARVPLIAPLSSVALLALDVCGPGKRALIRRAAGIASARDGATAGNVPW